MDRNKAPVMPDGLTVHMGAAGAAQSRRVQRAARKSAKEKQAAERSQGGNAEVSSGPKQDERPIIVVTPGHHDDGDIRAAVDQCIEAMRSMGMNLYVRGTGLVRVRQRAGDYPPCAEEFPLASLREHMDSAARWMRHNHRKRLVPVSPPPDHIVQALARRGEWLGARPLQGIVEAPAVRRDGTILTTPGYDPVTGLFLAWSGAPLDVPEAPTREDARAALDVLLGLLADFTISDSGGMRNNFRAVWVAALLSALCRYSFDGPVPLFLFNAPPGHQGAGKSLMAQLVGVIATGEPLPAMPYTTDDDEMRKALVSVAFAGWPITFIDNVRAHVEGGALEAAITSHGTIGGRLLGSSNPGPFPWRVVTLMSGNGVTFSRDGWRRTIRVELLSRGKFTSSDVPGQSERTFKYRDIIAHVREHRRAYLRAALVVIRAWHVAGRPRVHVAGMESFEAWTDHVAMPLVWAGGGDPTRARPAREADRDETLGERVVLAWRSAFGPLQQRTIAEAVRWCREHPGDANASDLSAALCDLAGVPTLERASLGSLGKRVAALVGRGFADDSGGVLEFQQHTNRNKVAVLAVVSSPSTSRVTINTPHAGDAGVCGGSPTHPRERNACNPNVGHDSHQPAEGADPPQSPATPASHSPPKDSFQSLGHDTLIPIAEMPL